MSELYKSPSILNELDKSPSISGNYPSISNKSPSISDKSPSISDKSPSNTINIIPLQYAPSINISSIPPSVSYSPSNTLDLIYNFSLTNYNDIFNTYSITLNNLSEEDFDSKNGVNFQNSENKYIMIPQLTGSYTVCFDIFVTSYNSLTSNYIFNQGVLYTKGQGYLGTGLGLTIHLTSPDNLAVNIYETSIGAGKVHNIPVSNFINTWNKIILVVTPVVKGNAYTLYVNGTANNFRSTYINTVLASLGKNSNNANFILGGQTGNGNAFNGYMKNFKAYNYALQLGEIKLLNNKEIFTQLNNNFEHLKINSSNMYINYAELFSIIGIIYHTVVKITNLNNNLVNNKIFNIALLMCSFISMYNLFL
jgi:hypothetical protein